ncbi:hypothetical protein NDU88_003117 [Pleurodeles waltl]|uniref:Uncharacterized protein n=1 Tax=Pleurodeles waltl TaxID=8319 RepID=A0AAV7KTZ8_PLEWA|nr:hypothetical protein NDU88_003117 [Pleurodeles waltl]
MELKLSNTDNLKKTELVRICKKTRLNVGKRLIIADFQTALRAFADARRMQATTEDQEDEALDLVDKKENVLATDSELQYPKGEGGQHATGVRFPIRHGTVCPSATHPLRN